ncbi:VOC family protein [Exiguobacterium acetylicum]|uniref:VOC family protein n=1 Tax=Exiguobacterium acetylicum TaxID=41170 RepID=UPI0006803AE6|nr:VOC family protein [Exiguobacterium acetylicum]KNH35922.1 hypothetical protein ACS74_08650 [Exiguobacterium acetylicum]
MTFSLYEAHLPVSDLHRSIEFYESLGLTFDHTVDDRIAFLWIEPGKSWNGLWISEHTNTPYHPSIRHIALTVDIDFLRNAPNWLRERQIEPRAAFGFGPDEPFVMTHTDYAHAKLHFNDPDGNSLEFICHLPNPKRLSKKMTLLEFETLTFT